MESFSDCILYILCCRCCQSKAFVKKPSAKHKKDMSTLEKITPAKPDPFAGKKSPLEVKTIDITETYFVGPLHPFQSENEVLEAQGYRFVSYIDRGAFGTVSKGIHVQEKYFVAIKRIKIPSKETQPAKDRYDMMIDIKNELFILQKVKHPHIVRLITHFIVNNNNLEQLTIIMQFAANGTLSAFLQKNGPFDEDTCCVWFGQMLDAMYYMHDTHGLAHRDLKLQNILLDDSLDVLISDFGLSRMVDSPDNGGQLQSKTYCGTPPYMAPELLQLQKRQKNYSAQPVDVWALGVILYKLFTKEFPFDTENRHRCIKKMKKESLKFSKRLTTRPSEQLQDILRQMFIYKAKDRATMKSLIQHPWVRHLFDDEYISQEPELRDTKAIRRKHDEHVRRTVEAINQEQ